MSSPHRRHVYEWVDDAGVRYVGWGSIHHRTGETPWQRRWAARHTDRSELGAWLRSLSGPPRLSWAVLPSTAMPRQACAWIMRRRRAELHAAGVVLLGGQRYVGSGPHKPVLGFPTIRAAARAMGCSRRRIYRMAGLKRL